jgi:hypothetical protein
MPSPYGFLLLRQSRILMLHAACSYLAIQAMRASFVLNGSATVPDTIIHALRTHCDRPYTLAACYMAAVRGAA